MGTLQYNSGLLRRLTIPEVADSHSNKEKHEICLVLVNSHLLDVRNYYFACDIVPHKCSIFDKLFLNHAAESLLLKLISTSSLLLIRQARESI